MKPKIERPDAEAAKDILAGTAACFPLKQRDHQKSYNRISDFSLAGKSFSRLGSCLSHPCDGALPRRLRSQVRWLRGQQR
ncbi:hypothetical protein FHS35_008807 [Streptomyces umbrinus]|nr:hypothetical protein [Streptomyces umbrinus]